MAATKDTRDASEESGDAPTTVQPIQFDARDRLLGRLDDIPVHRAAEKPTITDATPTPVEGKRGEKVIQ